MTRRMLLAAVASIAILAVNAARADTPNLFNAKEASSEAIFAGVVACMRAVPEETKAQLGEHATLAYCACGMDAQRAKKGKAPTMADYRFCMDSVQRRFARQ